MKERVEKLIPLGSVVMLKGATKRLMITGFLPVADNDKTKIYDYMGCLYPEGTISSDSIALFNHDQIKNIICLGFSDDEEKSFKSALINSNFDKLNIS